MTEPPPGQGPEPPKLPLAEAAVRLGKTTEAVRSMVRRGRLSAVRGNDGWLLVAVPPELDRANGAADLKTDPNCLIPRCGGTLDHHAARDALWAKFFTAAPARPRRSVARSSYVKRA